tara:strand:+ start:644 stop:1633 length:990 start_codon:yes stop_codon:yes gene_type:complete
MPKKVKKVVGVPVGDAVLVPLKPFTFIEAFKEWDAVCAESSGIETIGMKSGSLMDYFRSHVTKPRLNSDNKGSTGFYKQLAPFRRRMNKMGLPQDSELKLLENMLASLEKLEKHKSLNPRNTKFSRPKTFSREGKGKYEKGGTKVPIYGHYLDSFFAIQHGTTNREGDKWVTTSRNTATPPAWQALFGKITDLFPMGGLKSIVELGIEEIKKQSYHLKINTAKPARYLVDIDSFRTVLARAITASRDGDTVSVSKVNAKLQNKKYNAPEDKKPALARYANLKNVAGDFTSFEIVLTPAKTKQLIQYYMQSNMSVKTRTLTKSWQEVLVV